MEEQNKNCEKCGKGAEGYKCDMCGVETEQHDASHACGGDRCMPKCSGCNEAQKNCNCE